MLRSRYIFRSFLVLSLVAVSACAMKAPVGIHDPFEADNRKTHAANKEIDRLILKPLSKGVGSATRGPISTGISNFSSNLGLPNAVANNLLQLKIDHAFVNSARFVFNTTVGIGGLFDVATQNGLLEKPTDFGETLHVWGASEGAYLELPFFGPSNVRDSTGMVVDTLMDPINFVVPTPQRYLGTLAGLLNKVGTRDKYSDLVDQVLYQSEDSYAQSRLVYLQSRRQTLHGGLRDVDLEDPYANQ